MKALVYKATVLLGKTKIEMCLVYERYNTKVMDYLDESPRA